MRWRAKHTATYCWLVTVLLAGCATARPAGTVVELSGTINPLFIGSRTCWILETGTMREKAFYELHGSERLLQRLRRENLWARLRVVLRPDCLPQCGVGTCADVVDILELRP